ncbi:leucyl aminopeptidase, partial [Pelomonas sp. HMWF004]
MDFKIQTAELEALAGVSADALVVVLAGEALAAGLDTVVARHAQAAIKLGDFTLKAGQALTLMQADGIKAPRLVLAASGK